MQHNKMIKLICSRRIIAIGLLAIFTGLGLHAAYSGAASESPQNTKTTVAAGTSDAPAEKAEKKQPAPASAPKGAPKAGGPPAGGMPQMPAPSVRVETVDTLTNTQPKIITATIHAKETVNIVPRVSGYLDKVVFQEGAVVKEGDVLFQIEDTIHQLNVRIAESVVQQTQAEIELAKKEHDRAKTLVRDYTVSKQEFDQALRSISFYEARLEEAKANLGLSKNDLSYTRITSPLTGRIGAKQYSEGNYITPSSGILATIVQFDPIAIRFPASESDIAEYDLFGEGAKDTNIDIMLSTGKKYEGNYKIDFFDNQIDANSGTLIVHLICDNSNNYLIPGGYANILLSKRFEKPMPAINISAMVSDGKQYYVYVLGAGNVAQRRIITVGPQVLNKRIVTSGLEEGEKVIVGGLNKVIPNAPVNPSETVNGGVMP